VVSEGSQLDAEVAVRHGGAVLALRGDLDQATAARFEALLDGLVRVPGVCRVEIDARRVEFVDSAGIDAMMRSRTTAWRFGVEWFLGPTSPAVCRMLDLAGIDALHDASMN
jgi:anti-anti-sigma factor